MTRLLLICGFALAAHAAAPVETLWIKSPPAAGEQLRKLLPEVHQTILEDQFVEVRSAGLSFFYLGPFQNPLTADGGVRDIRVRIPRHPVPAEGEGQQAGPGMLGIFLNGVPLYNRLNEASYLGRNIWHFDPLAYRDPAHPQTLGVLGTIIANFSAHSPILGFALDGYPIYGPWAFANGDGSGELRRMRSGYRLRQIRERTHLADGTVLTPSQYGPPVDTAFPLGTFAEDYEYKPESGDLDSSNGRFAVTPEYPNGTYAYFLTTDAFSRLAFPYFLADRFRGRLPGVASRGGISTGPVQFTHDALEAGKPAELRFAFPHVRSLEIVHEQTVHLMIVSSDLATFDHVHPEWTLGDVYVVAHTFPHPGNYRLFAQFTRPGESEQLAQFDVRVTGQAGAADRPAAQPPPVTVKLNRPDHIGTGQDVPFSVELQGQPIQPYMGAWAHFVFLDQHLNNFIHAHPAGSGSAAPDPRLPHVHGVSDVVSGPPPALVRFSTNFSAPGNYKLWAQFQVDGKLVVIPFSIEVSAAAGPVPTSRPIPSRAIRITIDNRGFTPARIEANSGQPLTLAVTRASTPNCGSQIVFPSLGIQRDLAVGQTTVIELPPRTGDLAFTCGMGMFRGMIVGVTEAGLKDSTRTPDPAEAPYRP